MSTPPASGTNPEQSPSARSRRPGSLPILLIAVIVGLALRTLWQREQQTQVVRERLIMGTTCRLIAIGPRTEANKALDRAWQEIEAVNATMSTYDPESELSRFNAAPAETEIPLSSGILEVLRLAQTGADETRGAFDVTVLPIIRLWKNTSRTGREPTPDELQSTLKTTGSSQLTILTSSCRKQLPGMQVTLDGIAPGYAVQQAILAMQSAGLTGGLIDLGGDIACFGKPLDSDAWQVAIQNPWSDGSLGVLPLKPAPGKIQAVSTSGDYRRFLQIGDRRYSHILDPRTGLPATHATSVTVIADNAIDADIWATALSVLGTAEGSPLCEEHLPLAALFITGSQPKPQFTATSRFPEIPLSDQSADAATPQ